MSVYFSKFKTLLDELLNYESIPNCTCGDLKVVVERQNRDWVVKFLMGLDESYKAIKAQVLLNKHFSSLNEVYAIIQQEERRRQISKDGSTSETMSLVAKGDFKDNGRQNSSSQRKDGYHRTFCKLQATPLKGASKISKSLYAPTVRCQVMLQVNVSSCMGTHQVTNLKARIDTH